MKKSEPDKRELKGLGLSRGCAVGRVCMFNENRHSNLPMYKVNKSGLEGELGRVERSIEIANTRLDKITKLVEKKIGSAEAEIFVAQKMMLNDSQINARIKDYLAEKGVNAEVAISYVLDSQEKKLAAIDDEYISARANDIGEIKRRLLDVLGNMRPSLQCHPSKCQKGKNRIIVAKELTPALTVELDRESILGFVTEKGGINSHAAILARAMGIPAVGNIKRISDWAGCGMELLINGTTGEVVVWPDKDTIQKAVAKHPAAHGKTKALAPLPELKVLANIGLATDFDLALKMRAEGVGLYRTEFELLLNKRPLSEEQLFENYLALRARVGVDKKTVYRMFDIGSDKQLPFMNIPPETNPNLGWRGSRLLLDKKNFFKKQARALARVSTQFPVHIMYPMVVDLAQFRTLKKRFNEFTSDIEKGEIQHGIMFELPSACLQAGELFDEIDFASLGTNDLIQYLFAIDRENEFVSNDYDPGHPVLWKLIENVASEANKAGKSLSVCGELAGDTNYTKKFIKIGIREVSVNAHRISAVRLAAKSS